MSGTICTTKVVVQRMAKRLSYQHAQRHYVTETSSRRHAFAADSSQQLKPRRRRGQRDGGNDIWKDCAKCPFRWTPVKGLGHEKRIGAQ
jgi:hypothetical protein